MDTGRDDYAYRSCVSGNSAEEIAFSPEKAAVKQTDDRKTALVLMQGMYAALLERIADKPDMTVEELLAD